MMLMAIAWISGALTIESLNYLIKGDWIQASILFLASGFLGWFVLKKLRINENGHWKYDDE